MRRLIHAALFGTVLALLAGLVPPAVAYDGMIVGRVVDSSGTPLDGVRVDPWVLWDENHSGIRLSSTHTDELGHFRVSGLSDDIYRLRFTDESGRVLSEFYDGAGDLASATNIRPAGGTADLGDVALAPAGHITGRITGDGGGRVTGGMAFAYSGRAGDWRLVAKAEGDFDGYYDIGGLPAGAYRVRFDDYSGNHVAEVHADAATLDDGTDIEVGPGGTVSNLDASLRPEARLVGRVTDTAGTPLSSISVHVHTLTDGAWQRRDINYGTDANGYFEANGLEAGTHTLEFTDETGRLHLPEFYGDAEDVASARTIEVSAGTTTAVDDVRLARAARVRGRVLDPLGAASADVTAYARRDDAWVAVGADGTDHLGDYDLRGLPAGELVIAFEPLDSDLMTEYHRGARSLEEAETVPLAEGEEVSIDVTLEEHPLTLVSAPVVEAPSGLAPGRLIRLVPSSWSTELGSRTIQWLRDGVRVPDENDDSYVLTDADQGTVLTVRETMTTRYGQEATAMSEGVAVPAAPEPTPEPTVEPSPEPTPPKPEPSPTITAGPAPGPIVVPTSAPAPLPPAAETPALVPEVKPRVKGRPRVGEKLQVTRGAWPVEGVRLRIRWFADGQKLKGERSRSLKVAPRLAGARLSVRITAVEPGYRRWRRHLRLARAVSS